MKKNIKSATISQKEILTLGLIAVFSFLILSALAYWKISPATYHEFDATCQHFSYNDCMRWFYNTRPYFTKVVVGSLILSLVSLITTLFLYFRKKK
jgi:hypothetical protein